MGAFETLFNLTYLILVIGFGISLVVENDKKAKIFGRMGIILGLGDTFHLIPRIMGHLSPGGFLGELPLLSRGKMITSISMTIFYCLYYFYYRMASGDNDNLKRNLILLLAGLRIGITLLPQNNRGGSDESYIFGIYRNIPFIIMGLLLIIYSYKKRNIKTLKNMRLLISLSFIFYIPVVLFSDKYPLVGALMMPKTLVYLLIVYTGVKIYRPEFTRKSILAISFSSLLLGLGSGVFYREFTKLNSFVYPTHLGKVHPHILILGFVFPLVIYIISKEYSDDTIKKLGKSFMVYLPALTMTVVSMLAIGINEVIGGTPIIAFLITSGIAHLILAIGIVMTILLIIKVEFNKDRLKEFSY